MLDWLFTLHWTILLTLALLIPLLIGAGVGFAVDGPIWVWAFMGGGALLIVIGLIIFLIAGTSNIKGDDWGALIWWLLGAACLVGGVIELGIGGVIRHYAIGGM